MSPIMRVIVTIRIARTIFVTNRGVREKLNVNKNGGL